MIKKLRSAPLNNTSILFLLMAPVIVLYYATFIFNPVNIGHIPLYLLQITADVFGMMGIMGLWLTILLEVLIPDHHHALNVTESADFMKQEKKIDVFITTAGEPIDIVRKTVIAARDMNIPHYTYILDDKRSNKVRNLAIELGVYYITRTSNKHAKAGNVNNGLKNTFGDFFVILDADQVVSNNFLEVLLPYMADEKVSMVQSPQSFTNRNAFISRGTSDSQEIFYKYVCPAKNISNSAFCVGTNVLFRREAIDQMGGIAKLSHSEDIWTSYKLHELGWKTIFVNEVLAQGVAPETIISYFKQQLRWAKGGLSMLFYQNPLRSTKLSLDQKIQYFLSNSFYFVGFTSLIYLIMPLCYLLFEIQPIQAQSVSNWLVHYVPYVFLYYFLTIMLLGRLHIATISVALASFYPYVSAIVSVAFNAEDEWVATTTTRSQAGTLLRWIWPHLLIICVSIFSLAIAFFNPANMFATVFYSLLAIWNMYLLIIFLLRSTRG